MNKSLPRNAPDRRLPAKSVSRGDERNLAERTGRNAVALKAGALKVGAPKVGREPALPPAGSYSASDIEVLEGLEPVRRRPGMYIGGTDETALHHLAAEILDNAMDEAVAGHASLIEFALEADNRVTVRDNGRGIPVDRHPKFTDRSALEVIFTTLHSGGKFSGSAYVTSGGLHGVGSSVVNALSARLEVEVARDRVVWRQEYERGRPLTKLQKVGVTQNRRGTQIRFVPDTEIFGELKFSPLQLYRLCRSKAFLFRGVTLRWDCEPVLLRGRDDVPAKAVLIRAARTRRQAILLVPSLVLLMFTGGYHQFSPILFLFILICDTAFLQHDAT